ARAGALSAGRRRARAPRAGAVRRLVGVPLLDLNLVRREAQFGRDDLRVGGGMALALTHRAEPRDGAAGRIDADVAAVEQADPEDVARLVRSGADDLGEGRDADPHQFALLAFLRLLLAQSLVIDGLEHLVERRMIVAAVERPAQRRRIRKLLGLDEVAAPDLGLVEAELLREDVD